MQIRRVAVYCASSRQCDRVYHEAAERLGRVLAKSGVTVVYGGGAMGSMGAVADGALAAGGHVVGVLPSFMFDLEWGHRGLSELKIAADMHERKRMMIAETDAVIALPGGCGTFEELFEAMAWKRLGLYVGPIVIVNTRGFYAPCVELLQRAIGERFMDQRHRAMWSVVDEPEQVLDAIRRAPRWDRDNQNFAVP
jgi:uncharacterized protein (TIGR00730 family)